MACLLVVSKNKTTNYYLDLYFTVKYRDIFSYCKQNCLTQNEHCNSTLSWLILGWVYGLDIVFFFIMQEILTGNTIPTSHLSNSSSDVFWGKGVLKICTKFTGQHACLGMILIK